MNAWAIFGCPSGTQPVAVAAWLELAAPLLGPALDDDFGFGVELDGVAALGVEVAEEAVLPAAEREERHGRGDADVDADVAGARLVPELPRGGAAAREEAGHVAVGAV